MGRADAAAGLARADVPGLARADEVADLARADEPADLARADEPADFGGADDASGLAALLACGSAGVSPACGSADASRVVVAVLGLVSSGASSAPASAARSLRLELRRVGLLCGRLVRTSRSSSESRTSA